MKKLIVTCAFLLVFGFAITDTASAEPGKPPTIEIHSEKNQE